MQTRRLGEDWAQVAASTSVGVARYGRQEVIDTHTQTNVESQILACGQQQEIERVACYTATTRCSPAHGMHHYSLACFRRLWVPVSSMPKADEPRGAPPVCLPRGRPRRTSSANELTRLVHPFVPEGCPSDIFVGGLVQLTPTNRSVRVLGIRVALWATSRRQIRVK